jgi:hypothetical protein
MLAFHDLLCDNNELPRLAGAAIAMLFETAAECTRKEGA